MGEEMVLMIIPSKGVIRENEVYTFPNGNLDYNKARKVFFDFVDDAKKRGIYKTHEWNNNDGGKIVYKDGTYILFMYAGLFPISDLEDD